ncbi:MAG: 6-phosphofructokinase [Gammaproteobacteria bacterium WSBS_2016_MAG_OTU1]
MPVKKANLCYAQSGGVTAVINTTAAAVINAADKNPNIGRVFAAKNGILGVLNEELIQTWRENKTTAAQLANTPGGAFGSCRVKLPPPEKDLSTYKRLMEVFAAHNIRYFLYNGGNDSADTTMKLATAAAMLNSPLVAVGIPKTIDNDLAMTDTCPGFGSAAKYIAVSVAETALDVASMARTSTKVFVLEVMGRNAGWLAAAAGLAIEDSSLMILPPEAPFRRAHFITAMRRRIRQHGFVVIVVSEGVRDRLGNFLSANKTADAFAHQQLGGVAPKIAEIAENTGYKCHWATADYLQRSARHIASATDVAQAAALGEAAVELAISGQNATMPIIRRLKNKPYRWEIATAKLQTIANLERKMPTNFYDADNYQITADCRLYLSPLIAGESYPPYAANGLPKYARRKNILAAKKLPVSDYPQRPKVRKVKVLPLL